MWRLARHHCRCALAIQPGSRRYWARCRRYSPHQLCYSQNCCPGISSHKPRRIWDSVWSLLLFCFVSSFSNVSTGLFYPRLRTWTLGDTFSWAASIWRICRFAVCGHICTAWIWKSFCRAPCFAGKRSGSRVRVWFWSPWKQTKETQWTYEVRGTHPSFVPPAPQSSAIDHHIDRQLEVRVPFFRCMFSTLMNASQSSLYPVRKQQRRIFWGITWIQSDVMRCNQNLGEWALARFLLSLRRNNTNGWIFFLYDKLCFLSKCFALCVSGCISGCIIRGFSSNVHSFACRLIGWIRWNLVAVHLREWFWTCVRRVFILRKTSQFVLIALWSHQKNTTAFCFIDFFAGSLENVSVTFWPKSLTISVAFFA